MTLFKTFVTPKLYMITQENVHVPTVRVFAHPVCMRCEIMINQKGIIIIIQFFANLRRRRMKTTTTTTTTIAATTTSATTTGTMTVSVKSDKLISSTNNHYSEKSTVDNRSVIMKHGEIFVVQFTEARHLPSEGLSVRPSSVSHTRKSRFNVSEYVTHHTITGCF